MKTLNYGIIGCGLIADFHAKSIKVLEETKPVKLYGVVDVRHDAAVTFSQKYNIENVYDAIDDMLNDPAIDVVSICTPNGFHSELAVKAANHGKHIVVEKPMAITKAQLNDIIVACEKANVKLSSISQLRYSEAIQITKKAIEDGKLGTVVCGDVYMKYFRSAEYYAQGGWRGTVKLDGGGALMNQGIHGIDLLQYIMGPVKTVYAKAKTLARNIEVEDTASAVLEFENGALGVIQGTTSVYPGYSRIFEFNGSKGTIKLEESNFIEWNIEGEEKPENIVLGGSSASTANRPDSFAIDGHVQQLGDMIDAIIYDRKPFVDQYEGRKPVDIILAIYESARTGKEVVMSEFVKTI